MKYKKQEEIQMIKYLYFRNKDIATTTRYYMKHKDIAKLINKSPSYVQKVCKSLIQIYK